MSRRETVDLSGTECRQTHNSAEAISPGLIVVAQVICIQILFLIQRLLLPRAGLCSELLQQLVSIAKDVLRFLLRHTSMCRVAGDTRNAAEGEALLQQ